MWLENKLSWCDSNAIQKFINPWRQKLGLPTLPGITRRKSKVVIEGGNTQGRNSRVKIAGNNAHSRVGARDPCKSHPVSTGPSRFSTVFCQTTTPAGQHLQLHKEATAKMLFIILSEAEWKVYVLFYCKHIRCMYIFISNVNIQCCLCSNSVALNKYNLAIYSILIVYGLIYWNGELSLWLYYTLIINYNEI